MEQRHSLQLASIQLRQECIIEKEGRDREHEMTTDLIKIPVLTHTGRLLNLTHFFKTKAEKLGVSTCTTR